MKLRRALISVVALLSWIGGNAQSAPDVRTKLSFRVGKSEVNPNFMGNEAALNLMDQVFGAPVTPSAIEITGISSPEGPYSLNARLARERAAATLDFMKARYPSIPDSLFTVSTVAEDWDGVVRYLRRSDKPWKEQALKIIESGGKNRKAQLKDLWVGEAWDDLVKNVFPVLRKAEITVSLPAYEDPSPMLSFRRGYRHLDPGLYNNSEILSSVKKKIEGGYSGPIVLTGYHSPDGSASANEKLSLARAQKVKEYLVNVLGYPAEKIEIRGGGVDWEKFATTVEYSYYGPDRARVLSILRDRNLTSAQKKQALLSLSGGATWRELKENQMPVLCAVGITYTDDTEPVKPVVEEQPSVEEPVSQEPVPEEKPEPEVPPVIEEPPVEEHPVEEPPVEEPPVVEEPKVGLQVKGTALFGVGTNLFFDAVTGVNASVDIPVGKHWDITADFIFPWWKDRNNNLAFQLLHLDLGARYYFKPWENRSQDVLRGWFASASAGAGYYDFALWNPKGVQGEELKLSVGGGYTWALGDWWRLTAELGIGPVFTRYRIYEAEAPDHLVVTDQYSNVFLRPTTAKLSLTYLLHSTPRAR